MISRIIKRIALVAFFSAAVSAQAVTLYVSPSGNDQWSGRVAEPSPDKKDGPLASIPAALEVSRKLPQREATTILLRGGTYELAGPITLSPEDSGQDKQHPLVISAYGNEKPVLSGGRRIAGWKKALANQNLWEAKVPAVLEGKWYFYQLFVNGERRQRARSPNNGFFRIQGASPEAKFKFKPGDIKREWAKNGDVEVIALLAWSHIRMQLQGVDETNDVATLSGAPQKWNKEDNAQYYVENAAGALDQPGEWYLDRKGGVVTYWPLPGEDMTSAEVIAPRLQELLLLKGDLAAKKPVHDIVFRGLTFSYTDWSLGATGYADTQAAIGIRGDLLAEAAVECSIEDCTLSHLGGYAIELGRGCQNIRITGNEISDLGAGGIRIGETTIRPSDTSGLDQTHGAVITDNHLHHLGEVYPSAVGVLILQSGTNHIAHNEIHHLYYTAVSVGWTWAYRQSPCRENVVEFNHLHDIGQFRLSDMGAVYTLGPQPGTVIRNNLIHDVNAFTYGGWGLYTDEGSSDIVLENNVVYRCKSAGFHQHYGRENILRNNIFAFGKENQLMRTRPEPHVSFIFTNNIVYFDSGNLLGSDWSNDHYEMDRNIYFDIRRHDSPASLKFAPGSFESWQNRGHDRNSLITDPLFVAPEKYDFQLKADSPALKLGFKPIDVSQVGVRDKAKRKP